MKNIKQLFFLLCFVLVMSLGSCKKSIPPHLKAIPGNALFVLAFENKQMISKSGLNNLNDYKFFQKMRDQMKLVSAEAQMLMDKFLENPESSGLQLDQSYLFAVKKDEGIFSAMVFRMDDVLTFENNLKEMMLASSNTVLQVQDNGTYKFMQDEGVGIAWNKDLLIAGGCKDYDMVNYDEYFAMPQEKSIVSVSDFNEFNKRSYDIGFWGSYEAITDLAASTAKIEKIDIWNELSGTYIHSYLNFENGEAKLSAKMTPKSKMKDFFTKYPVVKKDFDNSLLHAFPETSYMTFKVSLNLLEYIKMMREISNQMKTDFPIDQMMLNNPVANTMFNGLDGDILLSIYGFAQGPLPIPLSGLAFTVKSRADFNKFMEMVPAGMLKQSGEHYVVSTGMMVSLYFAFKDNKVFVTDDADAIAAFTGKGFDKHLATSESGNRLEKYPYLFYINMDLDSYPENVRNLLQGEMGAKAAESLKFLKPYKDFSLTMDHDCEIIFSLKFKDTSQNSLKQMLRNWDEITASQQ